MSERFLIGLTGNIATGKSTVAEMLVDLGAAAIDADRVAHEVMQAGGTVHSAVVEAFGPEVVGPDGEIDRSRLGAIVFDDPVALTRLEQLTHPATLVEVARRVAVAPARVVVVEAIKLIESGMADAYDSLWVTTCSQQEQVQRLMSGRSMTREDAEQRVQAQPPQEAKIRLADVVIDTGGTMEDTEAQVVEAWKECGLPETNRG